MPLGGAAVIGGATIGSALIGQQQAQAGLDAANQARQNALMQFLGVTPPDIASQQLNLSNYQYAGNFTPVQIQALQQHQTAMGNIQTDPRLVQAQMSALAQLSQTGQMGMTPAEHAALAQMQQQAAAQAQSKNAQIMDQYARTGMGGSGAQLAAQLMASQGASNQAAGNTNQMAQMGQQNALQAISQAGQLGGQIQGQQFGQQAQIAQAKDIINRFNTQNSQQVQAQNVENANQAALRNLLNQQNILNQNTQLGNQQQQYNKQLLQQQFNNQMARASGAAGQYQGIAQANQQNAANTANMWAGVGQGVGGAAGAYMKYSNQQPSSDASYMNGYFDAQPSASNTTTMPASNFDASNIV
jgi:hypothetical protein